MKSDNTSNKDIDLTVKFDIFIKAVYKQRLQDEIHREKLQSESELAPTKCSRTSDDFDTEPIISDAKCEEIERNVLECLRRMKK